MRQKQTMNIHTISMIRKINRAPITILTLLKRRRKFRLMTKQMYMIDPAERRRAKYWKKCGVNTTGNFKVGYEVYFDAINANLISIGDGAWITSRCLLLCHKRDMSKYRRGGDINALPYIKAPIVIGKGAHLGMGTIVMPGVTIGEGAVIGAGSLITRDIPPYTLAVGRPAKVIREFQ